MKAPAIAIMATAAASSASAAAPYSNHTMEQEPFKCPSPNGNFCVGPSLTLPLMITCVNGKPSPVNCVEHTASRPPIDVYYSPCWQSSPTAGDAACSKNGTIFPDDANPFPVPQAASPPMTYPGLPSTTAAPTSYVPTTSYPVPSNLTQYPRPNDTATLPADYSLLPTASLPTWVTTVTLDNATSTSMSMTTSKPTITASVTLSSNLTILSTASLPGWVTTVTLTNGTSTRMHTIYSNCGNGTMIYGSVTLSATTTTSTSTTSSTPAWWDMTTMTSSTQKTKPNPKPTVVPNTIPCDSSSSSSSSPAPTISFVTQTEELPTTTESPSSTSMPIGSAIASGLGLSSSGFPSAPSHGAFSNGQPSPNESTSSMYDSASAANMKGASVYFVAAAMFGIAALVC